MYIIEYQPPTAVNRWRHRRRIRNMAERVIPRSYEWVMLVVAALIWAVLAVLFVGWWTV
ncbi:MAG: hypothetical protein SOV75_05300 [Candidatus Limiplasma sp.]|nr:hypothetical protein [Candidatus Limiplasma sp.]